jgi:hypothetical protein
MTFSFGMGIYLSRKINKTKEEASVRFLSVLSEGALVLLILRFRGSHDSCS